MALQDNILGAVPVAILHCRLQIRAMVSVKVGENAVLVLQTSVMPNRVGVILDGRERTGSLALDSDGTGGEGGKGGSRGSGRSRYHVDGWRRAQLAAMGGRMRGKERRRRGRTDEVASKLMEVLLAAENPPLSAV